MNKNKWEQKGSLPAKINQLKPGQSMVLFPDDYKKMMREIGVLKHRKYIAEEIIYKKASVIVNDELLIGVFIKF